MKLIRASEIGSYLYCRRAWWYRRNGQESVNQAEMAAGTDLHRRHGRTVLTAGLQRSLAFLLLLAACVMLTAFGLLYLLGSA
jgi:CRISPR/Cas system-associated exonuclease Cas4 (RecB family)